MMGRKIILASQSPRRRELMGLIGLPFEVRVSAEQEVITSADPVKVTESLSQQKAYAVAEEMTPGDMIVIGADTVVALDHQILGKPADRTEAREMITALQGRSHMVYTGISILCRDHQGENCETFSEGTEVTVAPMKREEIESYIATQEPYDKAGGYGIQGIFARFVEGIRGDYYNVMGLPVHRLYQRLKCLETMKN